ncbi:MAG: hypothetical protein ACN6OX_13075, partial [Pseudomonas sp.]
DLHREIGRVQGNGLIQRQTWSPNGQLGRRVYKNSRSKYRDRPQAGQPSRNSDPKPNQMRIALSDGILPKRLAALLACCREEEPDINLLFHPELQSGLHQRIMSLLTGAESTITVAAHASSQEMLTSLVAAGYAVELRGSAKSARHRRYRAAPTGGSARSTINASDLHGVRARYSVVVLYP